jgi:hypothetical protein
MLSETLRFESNVQCYRIPLEQRLYSEEIGKLRIFEEYIPRSPAEQQMPAGVQNYRVIIEGSVSTRDEAWAVTRDAFQLASDVDRAWVYTCGRPLIPIHNELQFIDAPEGWQTNAKEIDTALARAQGGLSASGVRIISRHWMHLPRFPLAGALKVRNALNTASNATLALVQLHYGALKSGDSHAQLFLLAKGLELGEKLLPGKNHLEREKAIRTDVQVSLHHSLNWLFDMSNNRFDLRHVVRDPKGPQLHPEMTDSERREFIEDGDLLIRTIICMQMGIEPFLVKTK